MAITVTSRGSADSICCFERPAYIGGFRFSVVQMADFDDCFSSIIVGTHPDTYVAQSGDYLQFGIRVLLTAAATARCGLDLKFVAGQWLSDDDTEDDDGNQVARADRAPLDGQWYTATVSLEPFVGRVLDQVVGFLEEDDAGSYAFALRGVFITNAGEVVKTIFDGLVTGLPTTALGIALTNSAGISAEVLLDDDGPSYAVRTVSAGTSDSIAAEDVVVINNSSTGNMTFNLPDAGSLPAGKVYIFRNAHASNTLTIDAFSTQTIDGSTTLVLSAGQSAEIVRTSSTTWVKIGS